MNGLLCVTHTSTLGPWIPGLTFQKRNTERCGKREEEKEKEERRKEDRRNRERRGQEWCWCVLYGAGSKNTCSEVLR